MTDHCDLMDWDGVLTPLFDWAPLEEEYANTVPIPGLTIRFGLELGEGQEDFDATDRILQHPDLDFVIGSIHNLSRKAGGTDLYFRRYTSRELCYRDLDDYFEQMYLLAQRGCFDVLGHISYPLRYMRGRDRQNISLDRYRDLLAEIFRQVIQQGKGIELNTNRGRGMEEWLPFLCLYRDLGGEIVTVGSDAHRPEHVGAGIREAYALLEAAKFRYAAVFQKREASFVSLDH